MSSSRPRLRDSEQPTALDDYEVEAFLGEGGMGRVHRVRHAATGARFAMKRARLAGEQRRQMLKEFLAWVSLPPHPNLVTCHFVRSVGEEVVVFAEYVPGGSLGDAIARRALPDDRAILNAAIHIADGLAAAHRAGVVHQDVKPANILVSTDGTLKVNDFGLARLRSNSGRAAHAGGLTPAYASPAQSSGGAVDASTDVWAAGLTVLEMFAGECFWLSGLAGPQVLTACLEGSVPLVCSVPEIVGVVLRRCFEAEGRGYRTAGDLAEALRGAATSLGVVPPAPPRARAPTALFDHSHQDWCRPSTWSARHGIPLEEVPVPIGSTARAVAAADWIAFDEARSKIDAGGGAAVPINALCSLYRSQGRILASLADHRGAVAVYDELLSLVSPLVSTGEVSQALAKVAVWKAEALRQAGEPIFACELARWAAPRFSVAGRDAHELSTTLAHAVDGRCLAQLGDRKGALESAHDVIRELRQEAIVGTHEDSRAVVRLLCELLTEAAMLGAYRALRHLEEALELAWSQFEVTRDYGSFVCWVNTAAVLLQFHYKAGDMESAEMLLEEVRGEVEPRRADVGDDALTVAYARLLRSVALGGEGANGAMLDESVNLLSLAVTNSGRTDIVRDLIESLLEQSRGDPRLDARGRLRCVDRCAQLIDGSVDGARFEMLAPRIKVSLSRIALLSGAERIAETEALLPRLAEFRGQTGASWLRELEWRVRFWRATWKLGLRLERVEQAVPGK